MIEDFIVSFASGPLQAGSWSTMVGFTIKGFFDRRNKRKKEKGVVCVNCQSVIHTPITTV